MGTPIFPRWSGAPTPKSCRIWGEPTAPADSRVPLVASMRSADGAAEVELDGGNVLAAVEENAVDQRAVGDESQVRQLQRRCAGVDAARRWRALQKPRLCWRRADALPGTERKVVYILAVLKAELLARLNNSRANRGAVHFSR